MRSSQSLAESGVHNQISPSGNKLADIRHQIVFLLENADVNENRTHRDVAGRHLKLVLRHLNKFALGIGDNPMVESITCFGSGGQSDDGAFHSFLCICADATMFHIGKTDAVNLYFFVELDGLLINV